MPYKDRKCERARILNLLYLMRRRCYNPKDHGYRWYGARGIGICDEWMNDSNSFYEWAKSHGYRRGLDIDRINNDGDYTPDNCRFVDRKTNSNNRRNTTFINIDGVVKCFSDWCEVYDIKPNSVESIRRRINKYGWEPKKAFESPIIRSNFESAPNLNELNVAELCRLHNVTKNAFYGRLRRGYTIEEALSFDNYRKRAPKRKRNHKD